MPPADLPTGDVVLVVDVRKALFAHPPFVDQLVGENEVLFWVSDGPIVAPADGGAAEALVDPFIASTHVGDWIKRFRTIAEARRDGAATR